MGNIFNGCKIEDKLKSIIQNDLSSEKKRNGKTAIRYYNAQHDIKDYRIFYTNADGELVEDKTRSNIKISHAFYTELIDQKTSYMLSGFDVGSDDDFLDKELHKYFDDNFKSELSEAVENSSKIGFSYMYAQLGKEFRTQFKFADGIGIVEIVNNDTEGLEYIVNYYVTRENEVTKNKVIAVEVYDNKFAYYYLLKGNNLIKDETKNINPRPHQVWRETSSGKTEYKGKSYGFIPFFRLDNNINQISDLTPVKHLIDDYDLMACGLSNNLQDIAEGIYVVKGFQGTDLTELQNNIKTKKIVGVGEGGGLDIQTINIPYEARRVKLALDENGIYHFGMGLNPNQSGDGNITNVVIKSRYTLLDLKCAKMERKLRAFMQNIIEIVLNEINEINGTNYNLGDVNASYERVGMVNSVDTANEKQITENIKSIKVNTLLNTSNYIPENIITEELCKILDIDINLVKGVKEKEEKDKISGGEIENLSNYLLDIEKSINTQGNASNTQAISINEGVAMNE